MNTTALTIKIGNISANAIETASVCSKLAFCRLSTIRGGKNTKYISFSSPNQNSSLLKQIFLNPKPIRIKIKIGKSEDKIATISIKVSLGF